MTEKKRITVSLADNILKDLDKLVKETGLTKSSQLTVLITEEIKRRENGQKK